MAYKTNNSVKHERKRGMDAMRQMVNTPGFDPQAALALAQLNLAGFGKIDDLDNAAFVRYMEDMRKNHPDLYPVFWWWRDAEEKAGRRQETDSDQPETRYRSFMVTQFLREPFSDEWEDDRKTLKPGATPLITEEQIADGLNHATIKRWAWIWHGRDVYTEQDEIADRTGRIKAGDPKFKHAHVMVDIPAKVPISTVARWFNVPPQQVEVMRGRGAFLDGVEYLPHESPKAVAEGKTHYDDDEIHASLGFDFRKELTDLQAHRVKYGKRAGEMTPADTMRMHVMHDGWNMKQCRDDDPLTYAKIRSTLPPLRLDYLLDAEPCPFRMNIYVDGPGGIGKTSFCRFLAEMMFPGVDSAYFTIGNDERVTFDGYDGQPAILWDDVRVGNLIRQFGRDGVFRLLDPHPDKDAQQAKHSRVILCNVLNIINGSRPYEEFISGLAGNYTDRNGVQHAAEDENQAWRRIPLILCVRPDDFKVLINEGFVNNDLHSIKSMRMYAQIQGSMKSMMEKLEGSAKEKALLTFGTPVQSAVKMIQDSHNKKISDPDQIPPELMPKVTYCAGDFTEAGIDECIRAYHLMYRKMYEQETKFQLVQFNALIEFARWFWTSTTGGLASYLEKHPDEFEDFEAEIAFAQDEDKLRCAIDDCLPYFRYGPHFTCEYYEVVGNQVVVERCRSGACFVEHRREFSCNELVSMLPRNAILEAVELAWERYFGDLRPLSEDPSYREWAERVFGQKPERGHKICPACSRNSVYDAKFCQHCGQPLPDRVYHGGPEFDRVRVWIASERKCKLEDVPDEDVKARVHHIDGSNDY